MLVGRTALPPFGATLGFDEKPFCTSKPLVNFE
jgi:hypothetical protein